jgi:hypothetical protein
MDGAAFLFFILSAKDRSLKFFRSPKLYRENHGSEGQKQKNGFPNLHHKVTEKSGARYTTELFFF